MAIKCTSRIKERGVDMSNNINELQHHGILGQKWGIRRYQNKDGTLTAAGKRREARLDKQMAKQARKYNELKSKKLTGNGKKEDRPKSIKEMSDAELQAKINRIRKEQELASLQPEQISKGRKFINSVGKDVLAPAAKEAGKRVATSWFEKLGKEALGLDKSDVDELAGLKKEVAKLELQKRKKETTEYLTGKQDESKRLAKEAADYENRMKIQKGQKEFKEGKYAPKEDDKKKK